MTTGVRAVSGPMGLSGRHITKQGLRGPVSGQLLLSERWGVAIAGARRRWISRVDLTIDHMCRAFTPLGAHG